MKEKVFRQLERYLKRSERKYKNCVKRIFDDNKYTWIKKSGKLNRTARLDSLWRRKQIIGRNLMRYISHALQHDNEFLDLVETTRKELRNLTKNLFKENVTSKIKEDSRNMFYKSLERICWRSFESFNVELFIAARNMILDLTNRGKRV